MHINTKEYKLEYKSIVIKPSEIADVIGYPTMEIPEMVNLYINEILSEIGNYCRIKGGFIHINNIQINNNSIKLEGLEFWTDKIIANSLKHSESIAVFVCTAGEELSNWIKQLFTDDNHVKAYIADIVASLIVEKATDQIQDIVESFVKKDQYQITNRYSPGYCGWNVDEQHILFSLLPENFCGVSLNKEALMNPIKSVSGIIGIGKTLRKTNYQCNKCDKKDCLLAYKK